MSMLRYVQNQPAEVFSAGSVIFRAGEPGTTMYVVSEGEVELDYGTGTVVVGPGSTFGEMALIEKQPRSATATARTDAALIAISQGLFFVLVHETPYFALEVMRSLSERLRQANLSA